MLRQFRLLLGVNLLWLALSMLFDGVNTLVLPNQLIGILPEGNRATVLGILSFLGLFAGMLIQPVAGMVSDQVREKAGRRKFIGLGVLLVLISLVIFAVTRNLFGIAVAYFAIQISASITQAGQQGLLPDQVPSRQRGLASGIKGFLDIGGSMLGFIILGQLLGSGHISLALGMIGVVFIIMYVLVILLVPEDQPGFSSDTAHKWQGYGSLTKSFSLDLKQHRSFIELIVSRFLFLLGTYAIGRFLLLFISDRLGLNANEAAEQAGNVLAGLALISVLASPLMGLAADRFGRIQLMVLGSIFSAAGALLLIKADSVQQMLLFGSLMSVGSAAFASANWAMTADLSPQNESARFFALANFGTAGAVAAAGLFGPFIDWINHLSPGLGYPALFSMAALIFIGSAVALYSLREKRMRRGDTSSKIKEEVGKPISLSEIKKVSGNERK